MNTLTEQNSLVCRELAVFVYTAFHSNLVSEGFRKPDVCQALWWVLEKSKKNLLPVLSPDPQPKGPLSSSNAPSFRKFLRSSGWDELPFIPMSIAFVPEPSFRSPWSISHPTALANSF